MSSANRLTAISFSHQNTGLKDRDDLAFDAGAIDAFVAACRERWGCEAAVLSTCNRTEFYLYGPTGRDLWPQVKALIADVRALTLQEIPDPAIYRDGQAARHLFRVAASLESLALGENEILGQVKGVHDRLISAPARSPALDQLFQYAIRAGKRVRTETTLCQGIISIASAAVDLAAKIFGNLRERKILIVGAGVTAETTAVHFHSAGARNFTVINRSVAPAQQLAERFDGVHRPLDELYDACESADIAVFATGAQEHLLDYRRFKPVMKRRHHRAIFLIDISNPRNVDPELGRLDSAFLYNIDDLEQVVESNLASRRDQVPLAEEIVDHMVGEWEGWQQSTMVTPTIASLAQYFEEIRNQEIARHNGISDEKRQMLDDFSRGLIKKLLHHPIMYLRHGAADNSLNPDDLNLVRSLYNLEESEESSDET